MPRTTYRQALANAKNNAAHFGHKYCVCLVQDRYHERIDPRVVAAFSRQRTISGRIAGVRSVTRILDAGRAHKNGINTEENTCPCDDLFVTPDGRLWACGHRKRQYGTVFAEEIPETHESGECPHRRQNRRVA